MRGSTPLTCPGCDKICHRRYECSGLTRDRKYLHWSCSDHHHHQKSFMNTQPHQPGQLCHSCKRTIRYEQTPLKCPECPNVCHKSSNCSKIPTYNRNQIWKCNEHCNNQETPIPLEAEISVNTSPTHCFTCKKKFSKDLKPMKCQDCNRACHRKEECSGIKRSTRNPTWRCNQHPEDGQPTQGPEQETTIQPATVETPAQQAPAEKKKCTKCKKTIKSNTRPIVCMEEGCDNYFHQVCTGLSKETVAKYFKDSIVWTCESCEKKKQTSDNVNVHLEDLIEGKGDEGLNVSKNSLKILQWNADGLNPKISEKEQKIWT